jgi:hypothetical protein
MGDEPATQHGTTTTPPADDHAEYLHAYARADAWARSDAGTPYGSETPVKEKP